MTPDSSWRRIGRWFGREPGQLTTLLGVILYASLRLDLFLFYTHFGVSPEEVGHGYASTLAQALVGSVGILVLLASFLVAIAVPLIAAIAPTMIMFRKFGATAFGWLFGTLTAAVVVSRLVAFPDSLGGDDPPREIGGILILCWWALGQIFDDLEEPMTWRLVSTMLKKASLPAVVIIVVAVFLVLMPASARFDARAVADGNARPSQFAGVLAFPWATNVAVVTWMGDNSPSFLKSGDCFMYLGRSDGVIVLWDPRQEEIHRVAGENLAMSTPDIPSCDEVDE